MRYAYDIIKRRKHVLRYDMLPEEMPKKELIEQILKDAHDLTPSKQNVMPYNVNVLGPNKFEEKQIVYNQVIKNHYKMEDDALAEGKLDKETYWKKINPYYYHIKENPYLLVISQRLHKNVNEYYKKEVVMGHYMEQCDNDRVKKGSDIDAVAVEVGLFAANLTACAMEYEVDVSYTICFSRKMEDWIELPWIEYRPVLLISMGHALKYRGIKPGDTKTPFDEIVKWQ